MQQKSGKWVASQYVVWLFETSIMYELKLGGEDMKN